jgi:hypothetical protein
LPVSAAFSITLDKSSYRKFLIFNNLRGKIKITGKKAAAVFETFWDAIKE